MYKDSYMKMLTTRGANLGQVKKNQSDFIMDTTFTRDPEYKLAYILTKDGWEWVDIKYQKHATPSILRDAVDHYVQFRPKVHYPVGSYIIIPDDTSPDINLTEEELEKPFSQDPKNRTQWWLIVGRDDANAFVRYNVLKCNWNFQWVRNGKICSVFGATRNANSYTSCGALCTTRLAAFGNIAVYSFVYAGTPLEL